MISGIFGKRQEWETKELTVFNLDSVFAFLLYIFIDKGYVQIDTKELRPEDSPTGRPMLQLNMRSQHDDDISKALRGVVDVLPCLAPQNVLQDQTGSAALQLREKMQHLKTVCPDAGNVVTSAMEHNRSLLYAGWSLDWIIRSEEETGWNYLRSTPAFDKDLLIGTTHVFRRPQKKAVR